MKWGRTRSLVSGFEGQHWNLVDRLNLRKGKSSSKGVENKPDKIWWELTGVNRCPLMLWLSSLCTETPPWIKVSDPVDDNDSYLILDPWHHKGRDPCQGLIVTDANFLRLELSPLTLFQNHETRKSTCLSLKLNHSVCYALINQRNHWTPRRDPLLVSDTSTVKKRSRFLRVRYL